MKHSHPSSRLAALLVLGLATGLATLRAQAEIIIDTFDDATAAEFWTPTWDTAPELAWAAQDAQGVATSGSLRVSADYFTPEDNGWEQMVITRTFETSVDGSQQVSVSVDVKVDPASALTLDGNYGYFELKRTDGSAIGGVNLTSTDWTTITFPLAATEGPLDGIIIQNGNGGFQGPIIYYLDNFKFDSSPPPPQTVIETFDDETTTEFWTPTWDTAPELVWDAQDAQGVATSGSLRVSADYFTPEDNGWEQMVITRTFDEPVEGSQHVSVSVDVKVDPASVPTLDGNYGYFELKRTDGSALGGVNLTSTDWTTITFPLAATEETISGIIIQNGNGGFQGPIIYYLDNLVFAQVAGEIVPPSLVIEENTAPGLKLYTSAPNENFQRQNIVYAPSEDWGNQLWWVNQPEPITYSVTWSDFPDRNTYAGFQGHIMLIPDSGMATGNPFPDYSDPNVILIEFQYVNTAGPDGTNGTPDDQVLARARFLHKVNEPNGNAMLYRGPNTNDLPVGILGELFAPSMLGTWSVTFHDNTSITLTAPDNATLTLSMPEENAVYFEPQGTGVSAQFGVMPNGGVPSAVGQSATLSGIKILRGSTVVVDESFPTATLDPEQWIVRARSEEGIFLVTPEVAFLLHWGLPDTGFTLNASEEVEGSWTVFGTPFPVGARRFVLVEDSVLPGQNAGFFRLTSP